MPPAYSPIPASTIDGLIAIEMGQSAEGGDATFRVIRLSMDGDTIYERELRYVPRAFPNWYLEQVVHQASEIAGSAVLRVGDGMALLRLGGDNGIPTAEDKTRAESKIRDALDFPRFQPPVSEIVASRDGVVWLRGPIEEEGVSSWTVLDRAGGLVGTVSLPESTGLKLVDDDHFWATVWDDLGVPWVRHYALQPVGDH